MTRGRDEGGIYAPRRLTWPQAVAIVAALGAGTIFAIELKSDTNANAQELTGVKTDIRSLEQARSNDSERLARVEEQTKAGLDMLSRVLNKLDRIEDRRTP